MKRDYKTLASKVWFVTGTSSGFGKAIVEELLRKGEKVVATARTTQKISQWQDNENVLIQKLDVTDQNEIKVAVNAAVKKFGTIDVLVNNAGWGYFSSLEEANLLEAKKMFEANFWGLSAVTQAVLPIMRKNRSGYIINTSSIAGLIGDAGLGFYNASKHAVEGLMKAVAQEVKPFSIKVTNIEPGPFRTKWAGSSHASSKETISDYDQVTHAQIKRFESNSGKQPGSPDLVAKAVYKLSTMKNPPLHFLCGKRAYEASSRELAFQKSEFEAYKEDSLHLEYGDEKYWSE